MRGWWQDLTDLVLPAECGGCARPRTVLCPECRAVLSGTVPSRVRPMPEPSGLPVVHAAARYADEVRAVLLAHKERGALALAAPLGTALAGAVRAGLREAGAYGDGASVRAVRSRGSQGRADGVGRFGGAGAPVLLVPVPSARGAVRARGHDPARRIALAAAGELRRAGTSARVLAVLRQRRAVADQSGLNSRQRLDNLSGALTVAPGGGRLLAGGPVVLVDDLMTTGASLTEAARAVRAAFAEEAESRSPEGVDPRRPEGGGPRSGTAESAGRGSAVRSVAYGRAAGAGTGTAEEASGYVRTAEEAGAYGWVTEAFGMSGDGTTAVYVAGTRESTWERRARSMEGAVRQTREVPGIMGAGRAGDVICAAVVAASPDSFEINRN
ncbi:MULTISPECIES: ComF family protein [unclassified Streptomyces]|uniref:ComF family protein n=1 Tax=unclassified Streptomyces TaxID=2593676 RepID=UPI002365A7BF|nr:MULTISPECIES: ComF family protein [unclassified Streptomyces]MDF3143706.1 ComF family protein [Streptomyces sp. T21Q-yed]WDF38569.1 ComF family protein [Streptomyces sp. T12]